MLNRNSTVIHFWRFFPTTWLIEPPRLFDFDIFSYLHIIRTPRLLETSEYCSNIKRMEFVKKLFLLE